MPRLKMIKDFRNRVLSYGTDSTVSEFFEEVRQHRSVLEQGYTHILEKEKVGKVLELVKNLFPLINSLEIEWTSSTKSPLAPLLQRGVIPPF